MKGWLTVGCFIKSYTGWRNGLLVNGNGVPWRHGKATHASPSPSGGGQSDGKSWRRNSCKPRRIWVKNSGVFRDTGRVGVVTVSSSVL
jgi:hypothetical protein